MHKSQSISYLTSALHVSVVTITHLQEHKTTVTTASGNHYTVLLSAAIVEELEKFRGLTNRCVNPLNPKLNPICYLLALLGAHHFLHVSTIRVKLLTLRRLMSYIYIYIYIYGAPILDVSRSHTMTQHSR